MSGLLLDGSFAAPACWQLAVLAYGKTFAIIAVGFAIWVAVICFKGLTAPGGFAWDLDAIQASPHTRPSLTIGAMVSLAAIAIISVIGPLSHLRTRMIATDTSFIETGCHMGREYVESLDRTATTISFVLHGGKMLRFKQKGQRSLYVPIESNPNSDNLLKVAPKAMSQYQDYMARSATLRQ